MADLSWHGCDAIAEPDDCPRLGRGHWPEPPQEVGLGKKFGRNGHTAETRDNENFRIFGRNRATNIRIYDDAIPLSVAISSPDEAATNKVAQTGFSNSAKTDLPITCRQAESAVVQ